jgi:transposase
MKAVKLALREMGTARKADREALRQRFLAALRANPEVPLPAMAKRFGVGVSTAKTWVKEAQP